MQYAVGMQYTVGMQYAVGVSAKRSNPMQYTVGVSAKRSYGWWGPLPLVQKGQTPPTQWVCSMQWACSAQ